MSTEATTTDAGTVTEGQQQTQEKTFTQAELDQIVKDRVTRERAKYADYEDLKTRAEGARTLEERLGSVETELATTKVDALRSRIAARFGISTEKGAKDEPSDADLFLTGTDEETLTAQAQRLADRKSKNQNVAPKEGDVTTTGSGDQATREFVRDLFNTAD